MDVNITRTEEEKEYGLIRKKKYTAYIANVAISLDDEDVKLLESYLKEKEHDSAISYKLLGRREGYIFSPPDIPNVSNNPYDSGKIESYYSGLLSAHKHGNEMKLSCRALATLDRENWIKAITDNLKDMKEMMTMHNIIADRPKDEDVTI